MKAVMPSAPADLLKRRKETGADRWDEMWEGVLHMGPMANPDHQDLEGAMETYLRLRWARKRRAKIYHNINLASPGGWPNNYRIPDLIILTAKSAAVRKAECFEGGPDVVVEIRSPDDETYEKFSFYASLGVPEIWVIDRETKIPEIHTLAGGLYKKKPPEPDGWLRSGETGIELAAKIPGKLSMRLGGDDATREDLPED